jgi:WD40 repeat protein
VGSEIIDFEEERSRHGELFGRADVLDKLHGLLRGERTRGCGWVLLQGSPGVGKSAIVNRLLDMLPEDTPYHLIRRGNRGWDRPAVVVQNLCARIERHFPERVNPDLPIEARLGDLLRRVSKNHLVPGDRRLILVLDGLDEAASNGAGKNPLPSFLPDALPKGVVLLCASRPMYPYMEWLIERGVRCVDLDDSAWEGSNEATVRAFWEHHAPRFSPPLDEATVEEAVRRAGGNVLHAILLHGWLEDQPAPRRVVTHIPRDVPGFLSQIWTAVLEFDNARRELVLKGLGLACAAREALADYLFGELLGGSTSGAEEFLQATRPFLRKELALDGRSAYRPCHECLREFIAKKIGPPKLREYHENFVQTLAAWPPCEQDPFWRAYALRHAVAHRLEAGRADAAHELCVDVGYLEAKCRELGVPALEQDFEAVLRVVGGDASLDLSAILAAVSAEASKLGNHPGALPGLLYNRLRCAGWSPARIEQTLDFGGAPPHLRLLHGVRLGPTRLRTFLGHEKPIVATVVTPGGGLLMSASTDGTLRLWALRSGDCVAKLKGHADELMDCAITPDGAIAVSTSADSTVKLWDLAAGQCTDTLDNGGRWATTCAVSPDGRRLLIGSDDGTLTVWDLALRQRMATLPGHDDYVTSCLVTSSGQLVSASRDQSVRVWDLATGKCIHTLQQTGVTPSTGARRTEEQGWINTLALMPDGRHVLAAAGDGSFFRWDLGSGRCVQHFGAGQGRVDACAILHDGRYVLCGMADGSIVVWDLAREQRVLSFQAHEAAVSAIAVTADGQRILSASYDRSIRLWDVGGQERLGSQEGHEAPVIACAMTSDGRIAVSASEDGTLKVWEVATGACRATLAGHADLVTACAISSDGRRVLSGARDGSVRVWNFDNAHTAVAAGHQGPVSGCAILPDGRMLTSSHAPGGALLLRDPDDLMRSVELAVHGGAVDGLAVTPDGTCAMSISRDGIAYVWNVASRRSVRLLLVPTAQPVCGALTPDHRRAVLARQDGKLEVIDIESRNIVHVIPGHVQSVLGCAVSVDGTRVFTVSEDGTLRVFDLETGKCLATLHGTSRFRCVAVANGRICAGDQEGNLWIIVDETAPGARGRPLGGRTLQPRELARLRDKLAIIYDSDEKARLFLGDVGMDATRLNLRGSAREIWDSACAEAEKLRRVEDLVLRALKDYPKEPELLELMRLLSSGSRR